MGISESNIDSDLLECEYQINNYSVMKSQGNISRLALYFKNDLVVKENSSCACTIEFKIFNIPGSESYTEQLLRFNEFLCGVEKRNNDMNSIVMGDSNINLNNEQNNNAHLFPELKDRLLETLPLEGFTQAVRNDTRHCSGQKSSLLDHFWNRNMTKLVQIRQIETESDHDLILATVKIEGKVKTQETTNSRNFRNFDGNYFLIEMLGLKWTEIYQHYYPTIIASIITNNITSILDKMTPRKLRTINGEVKNKLSVSKECLSMIRERNRLKKRAKSTGDKDDWIRWRKLKNQVNNKIRSEK